mgnify:CR=1 FL=1
MKSNAERKRIADKILYDYNIKSKKTSMYHRKMDKRITKRVKTDTNYFIDIRLYSNPSIILFTSFFLGLQLLDISSIHFPIMVCWILK